MKHKIGIDYSNILLQRKNKKQLPPIGKLSRKVDIERLKEQVSELLTTIGTQPQQYSDPASSEHNYHLKNFQGDSFIKNYENFYSKYSIVGFQELSDEAKLFASKAPYTVSDLSPLQRLKGMKNTAYEKYHPHYDERNYTKKTPFYRGYIAEILSNFAHESCRSALVCLEPGQSISAHYDVGPEYVTRLMIPVTTNPKCVVGVKTNGGYHEYHLPADGSIYFINSGLEHYAINAGLSSRYQIRICVNGQDDLMGVESVPPQQFIADEGFKNHPCYVLESRTY